MNLIPFLFDVTAYTAIFMLVVLGLGIIASMMGIFNFAHGEFIMLGAYVVYVAQTMGWPTWAGILFAPFLVAIVGLAVERLVIRRLYSAAVPAMLATYAIGLILRESVRIMLGGQYYNVVAPISGTLMVGETGVSMWRLAVIAVTLVVLAGTYLILRKTRFGLRIRATLENPALARSSGIPTSQIYAATFCFGTGLAGLAGALVVPIYSLSADIGTPFLVKSFLAVMLGGMGSFEGSVLGAAIVGATSSALPWAISPVFADMLVFVIAIAIVKIRPSGLIGLRRT